ncbi:MAG: hypothetical protein JNM27_08320 [Leptospirales bacterium]|nr:hypothetical protein [Leptospirales bacterium]
MQQQGDQELKEALLHEGMRALQVGVKYAIAAILVLGIILFTLLYLGGYGWRSFPPPFGLFAMLLAISLVLLYGLRRRTIGKRGVYAALMALACTPSFFFLTMNLVWQGGTAAFFHGPIAYSYFAILVFTGLFFEIRLSALAGALAAVSFAVVYIVARPDLMALPIPDQTTHGVISGIVPNAMKTLVIFATGLFVGVVARYSRSILSRMLAEQKEKTEIDRLFGEYVSHEVREKIKSNPLSNSERKHMAIMFTDLRGFTRMSEQTEPEEIVDRLNLYFDEMVAAISTHGGVVDKFIGDAILATFGGIVEIDNPCAAAFHASEEMQRRLRVLNENWGVVGLTGLKHGIGLHYAQVLQGVIGSRNRKDYTVIGDGVNLASRVESLTKKLGSEILLTGEFKDRLPANFQENLKQTWRVQVRGRVAPLDVFAVES